MTRNSGFKQLVRERARRTGDSYSTARAHLRRSGAAADAELVTRCAAPIVIRMRDADPIARAAVVPSLSRDQGTLLAFWILFAHGDDGIAGFCRTHAHRLVGPDFWTLIETGLRDHTALAAIVAQLHRVVERAVETAPARGDHEWLEFLDSEEMGQLEAQFEAVMPLSLRRMADHIRAHPDQFPTGDVTVR
jgi:hypothetical protein